MSCKHTNKQTDIGTFNRFPQRYGFRKCGICNGNYLPRSYDSLTPLIASLCSPQAVYCGEACQLADWKTHKPLCLVMREMFSISNLFPAPQCPS